MVSLGAGVMVNIMVRVDVRVMVKVSKIRFRARLIRVCKIRVGVVVPLYQLTNPKHNHKTDPIRNHNHITSRIITHQTRQWPRGNRLQINILRGGYFVRHRHLRHRLK